MGLAPQAPAAGGNVHQGDAAGDNTYPGGTYQGDTYQGDTYQGDTYQGDTFTGDVGNVVSGGEVEEEHFTRGVVYAFGVAVLGAIAWYFLASVIGKARILGAIAVGIGWAVGMASLAGAGRGSMRLAQASFAICIFSLTLGHYLISNRYYQEDMAVQLQMVDTFSHSGGRYTDAQIVEIMGYEDYELSEQDMRDLREYWEADYKDYYESTVEEITQSVEEQSSFLPLGDFFEFFGWYSVVPMGLIFIGIGAWQAFKIPMAGGFDSL